MFISSKEDGPVELIAEWTLLRETKIIYEKIKRDGVFKVPNGLEKIGCVGIVAVVNTQPRERKRAQTFVRSLIRAYPWLPLGFNSCQKTCRDSPILIFYHELERSPTAQPLLIC
ncbi:MAG: hypothetical protein CL912_07075 [Deltaproteobacteria bacterium]|nr:hypothetical protein [Deltaproteobacteria bacterium]|tara:strand:- start:955 stop:1296 length:342 start_codon:yes stop_codon:yes gene_type:complete